MEKDLFYMEKAIELAKQSKGRTSPNLMSASILVKNDQIIGEGFYINSKNYGSEQYAISAAKNESEGSTLYIVVEPCPIKDFSRAEFIKSKGIKRVVVAMENPNPTLKGKGLSDLFDNEMEITFGISEKKAKMLNETFIHYYSTKKPFVNMVCSMTLDGKISSSIGDREMIICDDSRNILHKLRNKYDAVIVGVNTIIKDNPLLNCKIPGGNDPIKIIIDSQGKTPVNSKVFVNKSKKENNNKLDVIVIVSDKASEERVNILRSAGAEVIKCFEHNLDIPYNKVCIKKLINLLGKREITSLLIESGTTLNTSFIENNLINKFTFFIVPKIVGGNTSLTPAGGKGVPLMSEAMTMKDTTYNKVGEDLLIECYPDGLYNI